MNSIIKDIIKRKCFKEDKVKALSSLKEDIIIAEKIISGEMIYCEKCDDYYFSKSFFIEQETKEESVCIYSSPITKKITRKYKVCPKGHKYEYELGLY